ncbi:hypothetical protein [Bradyrhizobium sp. 156]|uniref:hypothetical protein n=1 Tax=unclassified Bradyrhizobium TaxID=2631580 RepID=UPI00205E37D8|nr:hypothetical protein [Bradyrhizobium sp. 156]MCK1353290.1 hypothetical protein [Bradyrhizobium sp. CW7]UPJ94252.1 hypothetical protein IVB07_27635 [Bradyrhizobium sp. 172]
MKIEPALLDRVSEASAELAAAATQREHERRVDLLDVDAAVLDRLDAGGELAGSGFRIGEQAIGCKLHAATLPFAKSARCFQAKATRNHFDRSAGQVAAIAFCIAAMASA